MGDLYARTRVGEGEEEEGGEGEEEGGGREREAVVDEDWGVVFWEEKVDGGQEMIKGRWNSLRRGCEMVGEEAGAEDEAGVRSSSA